MEVRVNICPYCGKAPKVNVCKKQPFLKPFTFITTIQCKPAFRKAHLKIEKKSSRKEVSIEDAVKDWNAEAKAILRNRHDTEMLQIIY